VPSSSGPLSAVVVSGGKQYRVASGDRILVDRLAAEPGARLTLERVLMVVQGEDVKLGAGALSGQVVTARVLAHRRGPKIDVLRYRSKKRVRVHRGARADLTALEILAIGDPLPEPEPEAAEEKPAKGRARTSRRRARAAEAEAPAQAEAVEAPEATEAEAKAQVSEPEAAETAEPAAVAETPEPEAAQEEEGEAPDNSHKKAPKKPESS
jgi:large subunit ribosomal protein L21